MNPREEKLLRYLVESTATRLGDAVSRFGGEKARQALEAVFVDSLEGSCFQSAGNGFRVTISAGNWSDGATLMERLIDHAAGIVGKNTVKKEVGAIMSDTEEKLGISLYEIYFRLGIHKYQ